jgi:hypothetical protein
MWTGPVPVGLMSDGRATVARRSVGSLAALLLAGRVGSTAIVVLDSPLGDRTLLEVTQGSPVPVLSMSP